MGNRLPKTVSEAIRILRLFNEKAAKLEQSTFAKSVETQPIGFSAVQRGDHVDLFVTGPEPEAVEAFVLTLRFFVQDNESTSFRKMASLYDELEITQELITQVQEGRAAINAFLDQNSHMTVHGKTLSNREIFEVFLWGGLAHANPAKKRIFDDWAADDHLFPLMQMAFHDILVELLRFIFWMRDHNLFALKALGKEV